jgi:hypothetical protein
MKKQFLMQALLSILIALAVGVFPAVSSAMESATYEINSDVIGSFGDTGFSTTYRLQDTGGEVGTGPGQSTTYDLGAGFWQTNGNYTVSIACPSSVAMGTIVGTGQSALTGNSVECTIVTDNPAGGYQLTWQASSATMQSGSDMIAGYTPAVTDTPETWSVASTDSEWGARVGSTSTTVDTAEWGTADTYAGGKWLNVGTSPRTIVERTSMTPVAGDVELIWFGAEIGSNKLQPTGNYDVNVTFTVVAL